MRAFFAIDLPRIIIDRVNGFIKHCVEFQNRGIRYVKSENIHLTLKFLGDITIEQSRNIIEGLDKVKSFIKLSELIISGAGGFPDIFFPRVLWIGIKKNEELEFLFSRIEEVCSLEGIPMDKRDFKPHITIARVKGKVINNITNYFKENKYAELGSFIPRNFHLYQSELTKSGAIYVKIKTFAL